MKRSRTPGEEAPQKGREFSPAQSGGGKGARAPAHPSASARATPSSQLDSARLLLDRGLSREAQSQLTSLIKSARHDERLLAQARCALATALAMEGRFNDSLAAIQLYEQPEARRHLDPETDIQVRVQLGLAFNYTGDFPKAIAFLNAALRDTPEAGADAERGAIYEALARVYRSINEHAIARDHSQKALDHYRRTGDWRGLAAVYSGLAVLDTLQGRYESSLTQSEQAAKLIGNHPAPYLLGKIYANMGGACWFLRRPHDGIRYLEKAVRYFEGTEHKPNASLGYNNLGINLTLVGKWERAHEALKRALELAFEVDEHSLHVAMILDSLADLRMLRGQLEEARSLLERAVKLATENGNEWYAGQAKRTLGRCHLAAGDIERALDIGREALALAERIGDRQAICESNLLLAEAHLRNGEPEECAALLRKVSDLIEDTVADMAIAGEAQRISGLLAMERENAMLAAHHFGRSVSIYEILDDRYRSARAYFELGCAYAAAQPERAAEPLSTAVHIFGELGARLDLKRAQDSLAALGHGAPKKVAAEPPSRSQRFILRMVEALTSRELLLRELAALIRHETMARKVLILDPAEDSRQRVVVAHGYAAREGERLAEAWAAAVKEKAKERLAARHDAAVMHLRVTNAAPVTILVSPRSSVERAGGESVDTLLRVAEMGLDLCAFREAARNRGDGLPQTAIAGASPMPGFIHSSPGMTSLVEELHKIRSSDVTVLVTGESGTGKELVARAIHTISSRRDKVFVPFNCTAVPKELTEGYLFGYRRGAFTGAVADSPGVIRTAAGGTLFLDEIGDLPLDVQPKILRFLQEGEIQPLGESRPQKVDVRIIAATNTDLEGMVERKEFREDLYYRLNVIRLEVPPLRERRSEIPALVNYYVNHYATKFGRRDIKATPQAVDLLMVNDWPGNVRQLCNELQRAVARAEDGTRITPDQLSPELRRISQPPESEASLASFGADVSSGAGASFGAVAYDIPLNVSLPEAVESLERRIIAEVLRRQDGNVSRAARELGLTRRGLQLKLARYRIAAAG
ncbi:MAG TPA: sigma 54-interacting transcriptional regulator [Pyrinomonadaceae bacterium]|jgi:DNA-binding NtrC family response regulator/tetratricopeptide (TPR) repeat protein